MRIHLPRLESNAWSDLRVDELTALAAQDRFGAHELAANAESADIVLFVQCHMADWRLRAIRRHPTARRHWRKVMVYDERYRPWLSFPGLYVSAPSASFDPRRQRAWSYLRVPRIAAAADLDPDLLFSFIGSASAPCRRPLFGLKHPDAAVEEVRNFMFWDESSPDFEVRRRRYQEILARSRFVLCPRGRGTSTIRLYETMSAGRVPVIISDEWVAPAGPPWEKFTLRVREAEATSVVELLEERAGDWPSLSGAARSAYEDYFSDQVAFHRIGQQLERLRENAFGMPARSMLAIRAGVASLRQRRLERA